MSEVQSGATFLRKMFGKTKEVVALPNLIEVQSKSFNDFVQLDYLPTERLNIGLEKVLRDIFPVEYNSRIALEYISYELGDWSCICGNLTGISSRYQWKHLGSKKTGCSRLADQQLASGYSYVRCTKCQARVTLKPQATPEECRYGGKTYSVPLRVKMQLTTWDIDPVTNENLMRDIKEQEVFFCDLPIMLDLYEDNDGRIKAGNQGIFLINGVDRVVVSQIHRAPGVLFAVNKKTKDFRGNASLLARIIPARGAWLDFEFDQNDFLYVRIDKKRKLLVTTFLQALGLKREEILPTFYSFEKIEYLDGEFIRPLNKSLVGTRLEVGALSKEIEKQFTVGQRITESVFQKLKKLSIDCLKIRRSSLINRIVGEDFVHQKTGELLLERGGTIKEGLLDYIETINAPCILTVIQTSSHAPQLSLAMTLAQDQSVSHEDAVREVYSKLRPGDLPSFKIMSDYVSGLFFNNRHYDLTVVGRTRINRKLGLNLSLDAATLALEDIVGVVRYLIGLKERGEGELDDVDHLSNRCVRLVRELLQSQFYVGLARIEKIISERFRLQESYASQMPSDFVNVKPLSAVLREFFGTGQLSQFMDQTNPLAEMAHKRRLSALGPGGITRERATLDVRDVHPSHYGRICPIETPEGQNIGLISSLSTYARVNELGFIEAVYRPVVDGQIKDEVVFIDAYQEIGKAVSQATVSISSTGKITDSYVLARRDGAMQSMPTEEISYIDASPRQLVSVATALIPFLEHDDANRALMGSNMQRQAVPLIKAEVPLVGTGVEWEVGHAEGTVIIAHAPGIVKYVSADKIIIALSQDEKSDEEWFARPIDVYRLKKFGKSSHNTWVHYIPAVTVGKFISKGQVIAHGASVSEGELALGSNTLVAYMPWYGYNFEDAIVVSRRCVADDVFTSVYVEEFVVEARDTKLGAEEITRDIPNVSEKELESLDEDGIVKIGTRVETGDILVGKVTFKGDVQVSPEEKLLRALFGEKSREVKDTSSRVPPGGMGTVVDVKILSRSGIRKDKRYKDVVQKETLEIEENYAWQVTVLEKSIKEKIIQELKDVSIKGSEFASTSGFISIEKVLSANVQDILKIKVADKNITTKLAYYRDILDSQEKVLEALKAEQVSKLRKGDDLPSGVIKLVRVYVAVKRPVSVGDKMAGRHGNKGVVSAIVNAEDMPYLADGTPVDIVLNPLGVPGRMNVGQILETMLGMGCHKVGQNLASQINKMSFEQVKSFMKKYYAPELIENIQEKYGDEGVMDAARRTAALGLRISTPVFDGASFEDDISPLLADLGLPSRGVYTLYDGQTGEAFEQPVTVGYAYMMKLNHLADDKLHARSVGPCSLITQQPLGGKAQFGGQRLGEMEVWALFAYGSAHILQEMLTIKSDDVNGRLKAYEAIVRGEELPEPGIPESFNVLVKELQSLGLQVELFRTGREQSSE
jgi:DNA-directed RNA polymerase subunit beta